MKYCITLILLTLGINIIAQTGDECKYAYFIPDINNYCSGEQEFSTVSATQSVQDNPTCWPQGTGTNDLWFAFTPKRLAVYVNVKGDAQFSAGTLKNPSIAIYSGTCGSLTELACSSDQFGNNIVELTLDDINIGQVYYLRVDARDLNVGSFQLCMQEFNPAKAPEADCKDAVLLCDKSPFYVENLLGVGEVYNEVSGTCVREEFASVWYKWICDESGTLEFDITPNNIADDIDFVVYRLPDGIDDCRDKVAERCMASGETIGNEPIENYPCAGLTGLSSSSVDTEEFPGCASGDDNYVSALNMVEGEAYALYVNNYSQSGYGFSITFGGTGTFKGPEADFETIAIDEGDFVCDKTIQFNNLSESLTDTIVSYTWNFGDGSVPSVANGEGPHEVVYSSFGDKIAALTVETSRGCFVSYVEEFFVESCCDPDNNLTLQDPDVTDVSCFGFNDGQILVEGSGGNPQYLYSIDGSPLQPIPAFAALSPGDYDIKIVDIKGCEDTEMVDIVQPPEIIPDAGRDTTIQLGDILQFFGSVEPQGNYTYTWDPNVDFNCSDCLDPEFFPLTTTTYTLTATDEDGCFGQDSVTVRVEIIREVDAPNIIKPGGNINDFFNVVSNKAAVGIEELLVFDRWGNKVYTGKPELADFDDGWDGTFNGEPVEIGVYTWLAKVLFIDGVTVAFSGDITVVR